MFQKQLNCESSWKKVVESMFILCRLNLKSNQQMYVTYLMYILKTAYYWLRKKHEKSEIVITFCKT